MTIFLGKSKILQIHREIAKRGWSACMSERFAINWFIQTASTMFLNENRQDEVIQPKMIYSRLHAPSRTYKCTSIMTMYFENPALGLKQRALFKMFIGHPISPKQFKLANNTSTKSKQHELIWTPTGNRKTTIIRIEKHIKLKDCSLWYMYRYLLTQQ